MSACSLPGRQCLQLRPTKHGNCLHTLGCPCSSSQSNPHRATVGTCAGPAASNRPFYPLAHAYACACGLKEAYLLPASAHMALICA